jgi:hypothetical protein
MQRSITPSRLAAAAAAVTLILSVGIGAARAQQPEDRRLCVVNDTKSQVMVGLFAAKPKSNKWGKNLLAGAPLPTGEMRIVDFAEAGDCVIDIRATFSTGEDRLGNGVDVCTRAWWVVFDGEMKKPKCPLDVEQ